MLVAEPAYYVLGVDPGLSGALAFIRTRDGRTSIQLVVEDMPLAETKIGKSVKREIMEPALAQMIARYAPKVAYVERVNAMPGEGVTSAFRFGASYGLVRGVLAGLGVRTHLIGPVTWRKAAGLVAGQPKDASRLTAARVFPTQADLFMRKKDHGRADAALIARAGMFLLTDT